MVPPSPAYTEAAAALQRLKRLLQLGSDGVLLLVHPAPASRLRAVAQALLELDPALRALPRASDAVDLPPGGVALLGVGREDLGWLNLNRPLFGQRRLRVVLWPEPELGGVAGLRAGAPDFFDWISQVIALPDGPPGFAVAGLRAALGARPGVRWGGGDLDGALREAGLGSAVRVSARTAWPALIAAVSAAGDGPIRWTEVGDPRDLWRVRWALAEAGFTGLPILDAPEVEAPGWVRVHGRVEPWREAATRLTAAGAQQGGLLSALLDGEPEAVDRAVERLRAGEEEGVLIAGGWGMDPEIPQGKRAVGAYAEALVQEVEQGIRAERPDWADLARRAVRLGVLDAARSWADRAVASAEPGIDLVNALQALGGVLLALGERGGARRTLERALTLQGESAEGEARGLIAPTLVELGRVLHALGDLPTAEEALRRAIGFLLEGTGDGRALGLRSSLQALANVLFSKGDFNGAKALFEQVIKISSELHGFDRQIDLATPMLGLAQVLEAQGDLSAARTLLERVIATEVGGYGTDQHPEVAVALRHLGGILQVQGDLEGARRHIERALSIQARVYRADGHPAVAATRHELAILLRDQGNLEGARAQIEQSLAINASVFGPDYPHVAATLHTLATIQNAQGDLDGARSTLEQALQISSPMLGARPNPDASASLHELARVLHAQGDLDGARRRYEQVLELDRASFGNLDHYSTCFTELNLAEVLLAQGAAAEARPHLEHAHAVLLRTFGPDHEATRLATDLLAPATATSAAP